MQNHDILVLGLQIVIMILQAILTFINQHQTEIIKDLRRNQIGKQETEDL